MNHIWRISNLHCDSFVILLNLYGISININVAFIRCFVIHMVHPTKFLTSVGLAQACPN